MCCVDGDVVVVVAVEVCLGLVGGGGTKKWELA